MTERDETELSLEVKTQIAQICERAKHELLAVVASMPEAISLDLRRAASPPDWMSPKQLAEYWQLLTENGEAKTAAILKWAQRPDAEFPLPHARMGDLIRFRRADADQWALDESARRRVAKSRRGLKTLPAAGKVKS
jgi:hypothetical protein